MTHKPIKSSFAPDPDDESLVAGWVMIPNGDGKVKDVSLNNLDLAVSGALAKPSLFGGGMQFNEEIRSHASSASTGLLAGVDPSWTVEALGLLAPQVAALPTQVYCAFSGHEGISVSGTTIYARGTDDSGQIFATLTGVDLDDGLIHHLVAVHDRDVGLYLYIDGVQQAFLAGTAQTFSIAAGAISVGSLNNGGTLPSDVWMSESAVYSENKSAEWVKDRWNQNLKACRYAQPNEEIVTGSYSAGLRDAWIGGTSVRVDAGDNFVVSTEIVDNKSFVSARASWASILRMFDEDHYNGVLGPRCEVTSGEYEFLFYNNGVDIALTVGNLFRIYIFGATTGSIIEHPTGTTLASFGVGSCPLGHSKYLVRMKRDLVLGWSVELIVNDVSLTAATGSNPTAFKASAPSAGPDENNIRMYFITGCKVALNTIIKRPTWRVE